MDLFDAINEFFTGSTAEEEMMYGSAADEQREQAEMLTVLQHDEETYYGLMQKPASSFSSTRRQTSSPSNRNSSGGGGSGKDSARSVKFLLSFISLIAVIYLTYESYGVGKGVKVSGGGFDHPDKAQTSKSKSTPLYAITNTFTNQAANKSIDLRHNYYEGETKANLMWEETLLRNSNLEHEIFLHENNDYGGQNKESKRNNNKDNDDGRSVNNQNGNRKLNKWKR